MSIKSAIIIPARYASTRLPNKVLLAESGKPLIQHVYEAASKSKRASRVVVACDHEKIFNAVKKFGGDVIMTDPKAESGTERIAEVAENFDDDVQIFVNVQGDEPQIDAETIDLTIELLEKNESVNMSTVAVPIRCKDVFYDPSCVKVVLDKNDFALYFSRSVIPHPREWSDSLFEREQPICFLHIGVYAFRKDFLLQFRRMQPCAIELTERLEQLRALYNGHKILVGKVGNAHRGIDTREDYDRFLESL